MRVKCYFEKNIISIEPNSKVNDSLISVESDWSSVSYFYSIVAMSKDSELEIGSFHEFSIQGDIKLSEIYTKLGVTTEFLKSSSKILLKNYKINFLLNPLSVMMNVIHLNLLFSL